MPDLTPQAANELVRRAWMAVHGRPASDAEAAYTQAIAFLENRYGRAGQFARFLEDGGYNWGSLEKGRNPDGSCPSGWLPGVDNGNARCFRVYGSDLEAATAYVHNLTVSFPNRARAIIAAMNGGDSFDVASAMRNVSPPEYAYFEADASAYAKGIEGALSAMRTANVPTPVKAAGVSLLTLLVLGGVGYGLYKRPDIRRRIPLVNRIRNPF